MARIKVIDHEESTGRLKEIYDDLIDKRGRLADVHMIQSLRPESIVAHMDLYMEIMYSRSELSRAQREMMAVVVSVANGCHYCTVHHAQALGHYWRDEGRLDDFISDFKSVNLSETDILLCEYARHLTEFPEAHEQVDRVTSLKEHGLADEAILDATLVVAYFNFVNRIVLSLGVALEKEGGGGYDY